MRTSNSSTGTTGMSPELGSWAEPGQPLQGFGTRGTQRCPPFEHIDSACSDFSSKSSAPALRKAGPPDVPFQGCWAIPAALFHPVLPFPSVCTAMTFMVSMAMLPVLGEKPSSILSLLFFILETVWTVVRGKSMSAHANRARRASVGRGEKECGRCFCPLAWS